jgi:hypothetical protein
MLLLHKHADHRKHTQQVHKAEQYAVCTLTLLLLFGQLLGTLWNVSSLLRLQVCWNLVLGNSLSDFIKPLNVVLQLRVLVLLNW